jgi:uncharacterized protein YkwD
MKKIFIIIFINLFIFSWVFTYSFDLNQKDKNLVKTFINFLNKKSQNKKKLFLNQIKTIKEKRNKKDRIYYILDEILKNFNKKIEQIQNKTNIKNNNDIIKYDIEKIRKTWISWHNKERKKLWLKPYIENNKLNKSAEAWSIINKNSKKIDHKRNPWDSYYDYKKITKWMKNQGIVCKNIYRSTYSESIWRAWITCKDWECSDEIIKWIKWTFDYFMNEKWISWIAWAHYRAIVHPRFELIWFWIAVEKIWKNSYRIYHTTHYCTSLQ